MTATAAQPKISPAQLNALQRQAVLSNAVPMFQQVFSQAWNPVSSPTINVSPRYVGLLRSFLVVITGTINNTDAALDLTLSDLGLANLLSQNSGVVLTDLQNNNRIQTAGWHLSFINSIKMRKPFAAGYLVETDEMSKYGETFGIISAPATIAHATSATFRAVFEVPVTYSHNDLRGGIYLNVVNATMNLGLTFNNAPFAAAGADSTFAVYKGTTSANVSNMNVLVYQDYLDQLPMGPQGVILPILDTSTMYELKNTFQPNIVAGIENPVSFANFRSFLSTLAIYDNNPANDSGRAAGTDISYFAQEVANQTKLWQKDPLTLSQDTRNILGCDLPKGCYYMSSRRRPIETQQYGNQQLIINPSASTNGILYLGYEDMANLALVSQAGSLS